MIKPKDIAHCTVQKECTESAKDSATQGEWVSIGPDLMEWVEHAKPMQTPAQDPSPAAAHHGYELAGMAIRVVLYAVAGVAALGTVGYAVWWLLSSIAQAIALAWAALVAWLVAVQAGLWATVGVLSMLTLWCGWHIITHRPRSRGSDKAATSATSATNGSITIVQSVTINQTQNNG